MSLENPWTLLILPILLTALFVSLRSTRGWSALATAALRLLVVTSLAIALGRPSISERDAASEITALVDISSSITSEQGRLLLSRAQHLAGELKAPLRIVPFARQAATSSSQDSSYEDLRSSSASLDPSATNLEAALNAVQSSTSSLAFLLSDGYESTGHALAALEKGKTPPIFPLTVEGPPEAQQISISQLYVPQIIKSKQRAPIRVTLSNSYSSPSKGTLSIRHGSASVFERALSIPATQEITVTTESDPKIEGLQPIVATYSWHDTSGPHTVSRTSWLSSEKRDKVLLLSGTHDDDRFLSQLLRGQAYQLRSEIATPSVDLGAPSDYRAIILNNVALATIPPTLVQALPNFIRSGGGLVTIGGDRSYGLGGYIGSQVEELLPVRLVPPHVEKKRLNVAVQLVIDKSRSMAIDTRLEFAKAAAQELLSGLKDDDYIGIIGFDEVPFIALPISPVGRVRLSAAERISRLYPTKKTNLFPALDEARRALARINAGRKHVIVLTDGKLPDAGPTYFEIVKQMRILGATLSTVMVGGDADDGFLSRLAEVGGGAFYQTADPRNLPKIFLSDVKVLSNEKSLKESTDMRVSPGSAGITSTTLRDFPSLSGFVETLARDAASTELIITTGEKSSPLLASWSVERGRVSSFTSDANGRWSARWIPWSSINEFWSDIVESTISTTAKARSNLDFELRSWVEGGEVVVDLSIFDEIHGAPLEGLATLPAGERVPLTFTTLSPGHYQARLANATPGKHIAAISIADASLPEVAWEISEESFSEHPHFRPNNALLHQIAARSGGLVNPEKDALLAHRAASTARRDLTSTFASLALLLFILEIALRELPRIRGLGRRVLGAR